MTYTHLLFDLDHTLLDFDRAEDLALTFLLEEAGVASQEIQVYKDYYIPMNRAMWGRPQPWFAYKSWITSYALFTSLWALWKRSRW